MKLRFWQDDGFSLLMIAAALSSLLFTLGFVVGEAAERKAAKASNTESTLAEVLERVERVERELLQGGGR